MSVEAEDVNYWKTSKTSPDTWIEKAKREIERAGGVVLREAFGRESGGQAAYMLEFKLGNDAFKVIWRVLPSRTGNERAARVQAATMLYHDIKARSISAKVLGTRSAFFAYLALPNGRTAAQATMPELTQGIPRMFGATPQLCNGGGD